MGKLLIRIADTQFAHGTSLGSGDLKIWPHFFQWYRGTDKINDMVVITESCFHLVDQFTEKIKIAWLIEPKSINAASYSWILANRHKFTYILTHNEDLVKIDEKQFKFYPFGGCWIEPSERRMFYKTKNISIIASSKKTTVGHNLRHEIINKFPLLIDGVYGNGYNPIDNKLQALRDYRYSIVIENEKSDTWFTEKIIDCFACGTIPIYWGTNKIKSLFDGMGILMLNDNINDIGDVLISIQNGEYNDVNYGEYYYKKQIQAVKNNFHIMNEYALPEDWLYKHFFLRYRLV
jgi:hypothetical protein